MHRRELLLALVMADNPLTSLSCDGQWQPVCLNARENTVEQECKSVRAICVCLSPTHGAVPPNFSRLPALLTIVRVEVHLSESECSSKFEHARLAHDPVAGLDRHQIARAHLHLHAHTRTATRATSAGASE